MNAKMVKYKMWSEEADLKFSIFEQFNRKYKKDYTSTMNKIIFLER